MLEACFSSELKQQTRLYHRRLDHLKRLQVLLNNSVSAIQYETVILHFCHCYTIWQPVYDQATLSLSTPEFARIDCKLNALQLEASNLPHQLVLSETLPSPVIDNLETFLGHSYVMTGSKLGAQYILKNLRAAEQLRGHYRFDYFEALIQNSDLADSWETWKTQLDEFVERRALNKKIIIEAAIGCFTQLIHWFEQPYSLDKLPA